MSSPLKHIFLADDDKDDRLLFTDALEELQLPIQVTTVNDGELLMHHLSKLTTDLPQALFLDLNMPRKSGFACLTEIKSSKSLSGIPVIIFSTSYDESIAETLYKQGAHYYICKPADFEELKKVIFRAFSLLEQSSQQPPQRDFLVNKLKANS